MMEKVNSPLSALVMGDFSLPCSWLSLMKRMALATIVAPCVKQLPLSVAVYLCLLMSLSLYLFRSGSLSFSLSLSLSLSVFLVDLCQERVLAASGGFGTVRDQTHGCFILFLSSFLLMTF